MGLLLGVDVGSSGAKASAIDREGRVAAKGQADYATAYPRPGWAEQNPEDWFCGACAAIRQCLASGGLSGSDVVCLAFVGPAHNVAVLGDRGEIVRPTIHWSDLRSVRVAEELSKVAGDRIFKISGQAVNPSWTLSQLRWLRENEPDTWGRMKRIMVTKDYVRHRFTGDYLTDPFDAVGTQLFDLERKRWSEELCALAGLDIRSLPGVLPSDAIAGRLLPEVAERVGLPSGLPIAVGGADSSLEVFGTGALAPGEGVVKLGTSCCVNLVTEQVAPSRRSLAYPFLFEDLGLTVTATTSGTAALKWFRSAFAGSGELTFDAIVQAASQAPAGSNGLIFQPYLMGERTPHWDPRLRGAFIGLAAYHRFPDLARSVLEGVAFTLRDCLATIQAMGLPIGKLSLLGGGSKSTLWSEIVSSALGMKLVKPSQDDASFGAALLAGVSAGVFAGWNGAAEVIPLPDAVIHPAADDAATYDKYYEIFRDCTRDISPHYHSLADLSMQSAIE